MQLWVRVAEVEWLLQQWGRNKKRINLYLQLQTEKTINLSP